ncbi:MAG: hypothetical protein ACOVQD_05430, partial [Planktothrix agardhii]|uniref:hypothetical protein n=1 Tax=Planktothrix agardhii TaxID=1160 RepID=UPI003B9AEDA7
MFPHQPLTVIPKWCYGREQPWGLGGREHRGNTSSSGFQDPSGVLTALAVAIPLAISFYDRMEVLYTQAISTKGEARWL